MLIKKGKFSCETELALILYIEHRKLIHKYLDTISSLLVTALYTASQGVANISKYCCLQSQLNKYRAA